VKVVNHPLYDQWSQALDKLKEANDCYRAAVRAEHSSDSLETLRVNLNFAQRQFDKNCGPDLCPEALKARSAPPT